MCGMIPRSFAPAHREQGRESLPLDAAAYGSGIKQGSVDSVRVHEKAAGSHGRVP